MSEPEAIQCETSGEGCVIKGNVIVGSIKGSIIGTSDLNPVQISGVNWEKS